MENVKVGRITDREYYEITHCSTVPNVIAMPGFDLDEIQSFLERCGYKIVVLSAMATVHEVDMDGGEVRRNGRTSEEIRQRILAVKNYIIEDTELFNAIPDRVDSPEADALDFRNVFRRELKQRLLNI